MPEFLQNFTELDMTFPGTYHIYVVLYERKLQNNLICFTRWQKVAGVGTLPFTIIYFSFFVPHFILPSFL